MCPETRRLTSSWQRTFSVSKARTAGDPTAKRPNRLCDPYGQGGKPLSLRELDGLRSTVHSDWKVETTQNEREPLALTREFEHSDFISGTRFLQKIAAVAQMNAHFPSLHLERRIVKKNWQVVSVIRCHTLILGGLSTHDFHLAMVKSSCRFSQSLDFVSLIDSRMRFPLPFLT